jgi:putative ABC transport system permease protein
MRTFLKDLALAFRVLRKRPGFSLTVALTLGLGIGATTAIFSVVNAVLLRPLPYSDADRIMVVWGELRARNVNDWPFSNPDFADLRAQSTTFQELAAVVTFRQAVAGADGDAVRLKGAQATTNIFRVLGLRVAYGRDFTDADGVPAAPPANPNPAAAPAPPPAQKRILSYEFWQRYFGGETKIIGTTARLGQQTIEIIGVLEPGAELLFRPGTGIEARPDTWAPFRIDFSQGNRNNVGIRVVGRLKPDVTVAAAQADVDRIAADLRQRFTTKQTAGLYFHVQPIGRDLVAGVRQAVLALMGAVVFVLLIACANVANLLLARSGARERDLAVRAALGAGRGRLIRQLLIESLSLAVAGAAVGLLLAYLGVRWLLTLRPDDLPRLDSVGLDPTVLGFAALATMISAVVFGLVPAIRAARPELVDVLRKVGRTAGLGSGAWLRNGVVIAEVVLSFVLLVGSGLMLRSFIALQRIDPGFNPNGVLTFRLQNIGNVNGPEAAGAFVRDFTTRLEALPGVQKVAVGAPLPLDGGNASARWGTLAAASDPSLFQQATMHFVSPGYFEALKTPIVEGRVFTDADNRPDVLYIVIDSILARKAFPGESAVGKRLLSRIRTDEPETFEVIGVVKHQRHLSLAEEGREGMFFMGALVGQIPFGRWAVRTAGDPVALTPLVRAEVAKLPGPPLVVEAEPMTAFIDRASAPTRFALVLIGVFAVIALVLASVGLYSVLSTIVRQRTAEIGVRMAFGAGRGSVFGLVVGQGLRLSVIGVALGVGLAYVLTGVMRTMLVGVTPTDPATFGAIAGIFLVVAVAACGIPALRAARLDPTVALREE